MSELFNRRIAGHLEDAARALEQDGADRTYVHAFELAADAVRHWPISMAVMFKFRGDAGLQEVPGVGPRISSVIRSILLHNQLPSLDELRAPATHRTTPPHARVPVDEILDVDREYREKVAAGELPLIAPQRFNPTGDAWLPVLHTRRGSRHYTALFSNTAKAHRWGRTRDWVVLYIRDGSGEQEQYTVISGYGSPRGHRIVAGRARECVRAAHKIAA